MNPIPLSNFTFAVQVQRTVTCLRCGLVFAQTLGQSQYAFHRAAQKWMEQHETPEQCAKHEHDSEPPVS